MISVELMGGPKDGEIVCVEPHILLGGEMYFPHDEETQEMEPISTYRWLFGEPDHMDFVGYAKVKP